MNRRAVLAGLAGLVATHWLVRSDGHLPAGPVWSGEQTGSAWSALPTPCVLCGRTVEHMSVVVGGYACDTGPDRPVCSDRLPKPASPPGWPTNIPPDWPVATMPPGHACSHCGRTGVPAIQWPVPGVYDCSPADPGCWCTDVDCCGEWEKVGDQLEMVAGYRVIRLGPILRIEGERYPRRYLVDQGDAGARWYEETDLVPATATPAKSR